MRNPEKTREDPRKSEESRENLRKLEKTLEISRRLDKTLGISRKLEQAFEKIIIEAMQRSCALALHSVTLHSTPLYSGSH